MSAINMPGFTAEASLYSVTEFYRAVPMGHQMQSAQVIPQFGKVLWSVTFAGQDPENPCIYRQVIITGHEDGVETKSSTEWICGHQSAGVIPGAAQVSIRAPGRALAPV